MSGNEQRPYLTGKLWSGLILSNKLYSCGGNARQGQSASLHSRELGPNVSLDARLLQLRDMA